MTFEEVNPEFWIPKEVNDSIEGFFAGADKDVGENKSMLYHLQTEEGPKNVWGSTVLDQKMVTIEEGDKIRITFEGLGEKKGGKNPPKLFKVEKDNPESLMNTPVEKV